MPNTVRSGGKLKEAPWRPLFQHHMSLMASPEFVLSTITPAPFGSATPFEPRARYCIYRGLWAALPGNRHNGAARNPRAYDSDLPVFTTDVRMHKIGDLFASGAGRGGLEGAEESGVEKDVAMRGSGGGGPVEAVWWVNVRGERETKVMTQWRVRGSAWVVGPDIGAGEGKEEALGVRTVKSEVGERMRVVDESRVGEWSWQREAQTLFGNQSPGLRGSFRAPPPGQAVDRPYDKNRLELGGTVESLDDEVARDNFRVVIIKPDYVEHIDLSDPKTARRHAYRFEKDSGDWKHEEQWP